MPGVAGDRRHRSDGSMAKLHQTSDIGTTATVKQRRIGTEDHVKSHAETLLASRRAK
jgi:hypothetical protein